MMFKPDGRRLIGGNARRIDAFGKVTGQTHYVADIQIPGLLHARVLRSPHHHARLISLDTQMAAQVPGVVRIITAEDIPGDNGFPKYSRNEPLLAPLGETLKTKGTPIAFVVAESYYAAQRGLDSIQVEYETLPHTFDPGEIHIYAGGNQLNDHHIISGDITDTFSKSKIILETCYVTAYQEHSALEPEAALGFLDEEGRLTVTGGTHEPHWQRGWIARTLNISLDKVRFITPPTGGSFGGKQDPWPLVAVGLMAYLTRKPVRLVYSRDESFEASPKRHPYELKFKIGANGNGLLTGLQVRIDANTGGYDSAGYHLPEYAVMAAGGPYDWEAVDIYAQTIFSNGPKCGQFRGFGTPQSAFGLECALDELIQTLGENPISFRANNRIEQSSKTFMGYPSAERLGYREVLACLQPRYEEFMNDVDAFNAAKPERDVRAGVGVAGMWYRFGKSGTLKIEAHAEISLDGTFTIYCSAAEYGQGIETVMLQLAAETLEVPRDKIKLVNADTALTPDSDVQGASRATFWVGNAVCRAAQALKEELFGIAAEILECDPEILTMENNQILNAANSSQTITMVDVAREFDRLGKSRKVRGFFNLSHQYPDGNRPTYTPHFVTGAHMAEVQVDMETGGVKVLRHVAVHDVGKTINHTGAEGQIEGSVIMGLGSALKETYIPGSTTGFSDYILPLVDEVPDIEVILVEVPGYLGPLGAKGVGETAMLPSTPAIINAISRAIGVRIREIPATPERVWRAIQSGK
jgi:CO/xanthine dehydrogenase Mo-binding subunit